MKIASDERGIIVDWLIKLVVGFALAGVIVFNAGAIAVNYFGLDSVAEDTAIAVSTTLASAPSTSQTTLSDQAAKIARHHHARLVSLRVDSNRVVHVTVRRQASAFLINDIKPLRRYTFATAKGQAGTQ
jgi:hypothetical protein